MVPRYTTQAPGPRTACIVGIWLMLLLRAALGIMLAVRGEVAEPGIYSVFDDVKYLQSRTERTFGERGVSLYALSTRCQRAVKGQSAKRGGQAVGESRPSATLCATKPSQPPRIIAYEGCRLFPPKSLYPLVESTATGPGTGRRRPREPGLGSGWPPPLTSSPAPSNSRSRRVALPQNHRAFFFFFFFSFLFLPLLDSR